MTCVPQTRLLYLLGEPVHVCVGLSPVTFITVEQVGVDADRGVKLPPAVDQAGRSIPVTCLELQDKASLTAKHSTGRNVRFMFPESVTKPHSLEIAMLISLPFSSL